MLYDCLYEFAVLAEHKNLSTAADALGLSRATLGRHVAELEGHLGSRLVDRTTSGAYPTVEGHRLLGIAQDVASIVESVERHYADPARIQKERRLCLAGLSTSPELEAAIDHAKKGLASQGYAISTEWSAPNPTSDPKNVAASLARGTLDVYVDYRFRADQVAAQAPLSCTPVAQVPLAALLCVDHPLAGRPRIDAGELKGFTFVRPNGTVTPQAALWIETARACSQLGIPLSSRPALRDDLLFDVCMPSGRDLVVEALERVNPRMLRAADAVAVPIDGVALEVCALTRADDALALAFVGAMAHKDPLPILERHSLYGTVGRDAPFSDVLTREDRALQLARVLDEPAVASDLVLPDGRIVDRAYVALRNRLNRMSDGLSNDPAETSYDAIMSLWSVEEARMELEMPLLSWFTAYDWAASSGRPLETCERVLEGFSRRGLVYRVQRGGVLHYCLFAWVYGIWEANLPHFGDGFLSKGILGTDPGTGSRFPVMRVCPVGPEVISEGAPAPYCDWRQHVERQSVCCVAPCQCRRAQGVDSHSELPDAEVCLVFGEMAQFWLDRGLARPVSTAECLEIARRAIEEDGLVPQLMFDKNPEVMCLCNPSYCLTLSAVRATEGRLDSMELLSTYRLEVDPAVCCGCGACEDRCPMQAVECDEQGARRAKETCVGCGQCAMVCSTGARRLVPKETSQRVEPPEDLLDGYRWRSADRMARGLVKDFSADHLAL